MQNLKEGKLGGQNKIPVWRKMIERLAIFKKF